MAATCYCVCPCSFVISIVLWIAWGRSNCVASEITLGSSLRDNQVWVSDNGTFALGFTAADDKDKFLLGIWYAQLPGDRTLVWSPNRNSPVTKSAVVELDRTGNLVLSDDSTTVWTSNTSHAGVRAATLSETGNFMLYNSTDYITWQSFSHPSDTLLPNQPLTVSQELTSSLSSPRGGYHALTMLQQPTSLILALTYSPSLDQSNTNYSYWTGPDISNATGEVTAVLNAAGSFGIVYGDSSNGAVYVYKNDGDTGGLLPVTGSDMLVGPNRVLRRLTLEPNGNLRLYRWDNDLNGTRQWVSEWAAVSNPCDIAGICGTGVCNLDRSKTNASCLCLPGMDTIEARSGAHLCSGNPSPIRNCDSRNGSKIDPNELKISMVQQTNYYFSEYSVIANYSDIKSVSKCGNMCSSDCECVASVYGLDEEKPYCWLLRSLDFGGFADPGSTLFVKAGGSDGSSGLSESTRKKVLVAPIVVVMVVLLGLLFSLLYYNVHRKRLLKRAMESSLMFLSGAPMSFSYRDMQIRTRNFSHLLGTGGFGSVYKGTLVDGTLIAVKKLDRVLPHGEKEFITEVNTIGSMHHMNLVRLCGYCSEGRQRLLIYEFMPNGSLDKWIFPSSSSSHNPNEKLLDWTTRFRIALQTAQGIAYFHEQCRNRIIHCDIKPENILLDENFCPKVSDFGLAKLMGREHSQVMTMIRGTRGYLAPEWISNRPITVKADVYSYGMLLLEIVGGRRNLDMSYDTEDFFYPGWAYKELTNKTPLKVADRRLEGLVEEEELWRALEVGFWCIQDDVFMRPTMGEVVKMLEGSVEIKTPPMPQTVLELIEEGLDQVYKAMKTEEEEEEEEFNPITSLTFTTHLTTSNATCSYSTMSPR